MRAQIRKTAQEQASPRDEDPLEEARWKEREANEQARDTRRFERILALVAHGGDLFHSFLATVTDQLFHCNTAKRDKEIVITLHEPLEHHHAK